MEQIFSAIPAIIGDLNANAKTDEAVVFAAWTKCAGGLLRTCTEPLEYKNRRLVVGVRDDTWQRHLQGLSGQMIFKMNSLLREGTVRFVEFRIDSAADKRADTAKQSTPDRIFAIPPSLLQAAERIQDEGLRSTFLEAAAWYLTRQEENYRTPYGR